MPFARAQSADDKIQQLEQKVDQLDQQIKVDERNKELADEDAAAKAATGVTASADTTGFTIKSNDGNFLLKIGADLQVDNRMYFGQGASAGTDGMLLRRVRPTISGTVYKYVDYFFRPDFGQGSTIIYDAYLELKYFSKAKVRVGKFKPPVGLERLQSDDDTSFVERGLPTLLVPSRDIGYQISGDLLPQLNYAVGVFNGVADNSLSDASVSSHRDYNARLFVSPFKGTSVKAFDGLGFGSGIDGGGVDGEPLPAYKTFGQTTFLTFASGVTEDGHRTRVTPQGYYYVGPFGILSEYTLTEEGLKKGAVQRDVAFRAWQVEFSYILTGEKKSFASPTPKKSFDPLHGGWGAVELAVRTGEFSAEHGLFNYGYASYLTSPRTAREKVAGVNWFLNRLVRLSLDYGLTNFGGGAAVSLGGNRAPERALIGRFQINFI
jgi:phosphate-selective porin OprO/OprP